MFPPLKRLATSIESIWFQTTNNVHLSWHNYRDNEEKVISITRSNDAYHFTRNSFFDLPFGIRIGFRWDERYGEYPDSQPHTIVTGTLMSSQVVQTQSNPIIIDPATSQIRVPFVFEGKQCAFTISPLRPLPFGEASMVESYMDYMHIAFLNIGVGLADDCDAINTFLENIYLRLDLVGVAFFRNTEQIVSYQKVPLDFKSLVPTNTRRVLEREEHYRDGVHFLLTYLPVATSQYSLIFALDASHCFIRAAEFRFNSMIAILAALHHSTATFARDSRALNRMISMIEQTNLLSIVERSNEYTETHGLIFDNVPNVNFDDDLHVSFLPNTGHSRVHRNTWSSHKFPELAARQETRSTVSTIDLSPEPAELDVIRASTSAVVSTKTSQPMVMHLSQTNAIQQQDEGWVSATTSIYHDDANKENVNLALVEDVTKFHEPHELLNAAIAEQQLASEFLGLHRIAKDLTVDDGTRLAQELGYIHPIEKLSDIGKLVGDYAELKSAQGLTVTYRALKISSGGYCIYSSRELMAMRSLVSSSAAYSKQRGIMLFEIDYEVGKVRELMNDNVYSLAAFYQTIIDEETASQVINQRVTQTFIRSNDQQKWAVMASMEFNDKTLLISLDADDEIRSLQKVRQVFDASEQAMAASETLLWIFDDSLHADRKFHPTRSGYIALNWSLLNAETAREQMKIALQTGVYQNIDLENQEVYFSRGEKVADEKVYGISLPFKSMSREYSVAVDEHKRFSDNEKHEAQIRKYINEMMNTMRFLIKVSELTIDDPDHIVTLLSHALESIVT